MTTAEAQAMAACSGYGFIDRNNDGWVTAEEWTEFRTGGFSYWDTRISRGWLQNCWQAGRFYRDPYCRPEYWTNYWTAFDVNNDGYLSADEYWSAQAFARADRNGNGRIDPDEWQWWMYLADEWR